MIPKLKSSEEQKREEDKYYQIVNDLESGGPYYDRKQAEGLRNMDYFAGRQWNERELRAHEQQMRKAYVFNEVQRIIENLIGTQTQTRLDALLLPREKGDEAAVEKMNYILKWVDQLNDMDFLETSVFTDGIVKGFGACVVRWKKEDIEYGYPVVEKIPFNELYWDINSKDLGLHDARWIARVFEVTRDDAKEMFPNYKDTIEQNSGLWSPIYNQRNYKDSYKKKHSNYRESVRIIEYYEKEKRIEYVVADDIAGHIYSFESNKEANDLYVELVDIYTRDNISITSENGTDLLAILETSKDQFIQTIVIGDQIANIEEVELPDFPFVLYFSNFDDGDFWAVVNNFIDPQDLVNRSFSQLDFQLGATGKSLMSVIEPRLSKYKIEDVRREMGKPGGVIPVIDHSAIMQHPPQPVNPEIFNNIMFGIQRINDYAGGKNALGLQEGSRESAKATMARATQAGVANLPLFDRLRYWRKEVVLRIVWYLKNYMTNAQSYRVIGDDNQISFIDIDDGTLNTLKEIQYDVVISEASIAKSYKEAQLTQVTQALQVIPGISPNVAASILLELMDLPLSIKTKLQETIKADQIVQQQEQQALQQNKMQEEVKLALDKKQLKKSLEEQKIMEQYQLMQQQKAGQPQTIQDRLADLETAKQSVVNANGKTFDLGGLEQQVAQEQK